MKKLYLFILVLNAVVGTWSVSEILSWFGKTIPTWADFIIGLFVGQFSIPIAVIGKILKACGIF